jgi:protein-disulfide isomerase
VQRDSLLLAAADAGRLDGRETAPIWVVMISDFQCPYCKQWHDDAMVQVRRDYVNKGLVRLAYLHLPLQQHSHALTEAVAATCAGVQKKFWPFAERLFAAQDEVAKATTIEPLVTRIARDLALDSASMASCRVNPVIRQLIQSDIDQSTRAKVGSTPSFLVGDFLVQGAIPYADFRKAIDTALVVARSAKKPQ